MTFQRVQAALAEQVAISRLLARLAESIPAASERRSLLKQMHGISQSIPCPHNESHVLEFIVEVLALPSTVDGVIVEAGCYKGGSTAKFSLAAARSGRRLVVFDSFSGLPENAEPHDATIFGESVKGWFTGGAFAGSLDEVRTNVSRHGLIDQCEFVPGWFDTTMPTFTTPVAAAYLDVDLAESTKTCLQYLYPLISPGGFIMSQDGDFPLVVEAIADEAFWRSSVGCQMPPIAGLGSKKIITIHKPEARETESPVAHAV